MAKLMEISGRKPRKKKPKRKGLGTGTKRGTYRMAPDDTMSPLLPIGVVTRQQPYLEPPTGRTSSLLPPKAGNIAGVAIHDAEIAFKNSDYKKALRLANKAAKSRNRGIKQDAAWIKYRVNRAKKMGVKIK